MATNNNENVEEAYEETSLTWKEWLVKRKEFMSTYPKDKKVIEGPEWDALMELQPRLWEYDLPDTLSVECLEELAEVLNWGQEDPETAHSLEKRAMEMFISGVAKGSHAPEVAQKLAQKLMEIGGIPFSRWFA